MPKVSAIASLVDGSRFELSVERSDFDRALRAGLTGKAFIVELLGDDIRPPPRFVDFIDVASDEGEFSVRVVFE